mgnify:FL=1
MAPRVYVALYVRKSNEDLDKLSIDAQIQQGRDYCDRMSEEGWTIRDEHIFMDEESAYAKPATARDSFMEMIDQACAKKPPFTKILVWKIDRFARRMRDSTHYIDLLERNNVELISMTQQFGTGAGGRLSMGVMQLLAQFFSDNLSEDVTRGLRALALKGYWTSNRVPLGYERYNIDGKRYKLRIVEENAAVVRQIFELVNKGWSIKEIAKEVPLSYATIKKLVKNENYTGDRVVYNKARTQPVFRVSDIHPAIISKKCFAKAQKELARRRKFGNADGVGKALYCGILRCHCGRAMVSSADRGTVYYRCNGKREGTYCNRGNVREDQITDILLDLFDEELFSSKAIHEMFVLAEKKRQDGDIEKATRHLNRKLAENKAARQRFIEMVHVGVFDADDIKEKMQALRVEADALEEKLDFAPEQPIDFRVMKTLLDRLKKDLRGSSLKMRDAVRELVKEIQVDLPTIRLETHFLGIEEFYVADYYPRPVVPQDWRCMDRVAQLRLVTQMQRWNQDKRKLGGKNRWTKPQIETYIQDYILQNGPYSKEEVPKTRRKTPRSNVA